MSSCSRPTPTHVSGVGSVLPELGLGAAVGPGGGNTVPVERSAGAGDWRPSSHTPVSRHGDSTRPPTIPTVAIGQRANARRRRSPGPATARRGAGHAQHRCAGRPDGVKREIRHMAEPLRIGGY